jgi:adenine deaminase
LKKGAIATSIAHDSPNDIAVGFNDREIVESINSVINMKGGISAISGEKSMNVQLKYAVLMSNGSADIIAKKLKK